MGAERDAIGGSGRRAAAAATVIRRERPDDVGAIRDVNQRAFGRPAEADLVAALRARGGVILSLVALRIDLVVGHLLVSPVTIESSAGSYASLGLGPMAVMPDVQRRGVGSLLVEETLAECRAMGHSSIVVLGHPTYYTRFGFVPASRFGLRCEFGGVPDEAFMSLELENGALQGRSGVVRYRSEFRDV